MSKEMERQSLELREDDSMGSVKIADDVVAMIAALAATEVEGVSSMVGNITHELMNKMGYKNIARGVKVEVFNKKVKVDISVNIEYGYNIPTTGRNIQTKVQNAIERAGGNGCEYPDCRRQYGEGGKIDKTSIQSYFSGT